MESTQTEQFLQRLSRQAQNILSMPEGTKPCDVTQMLQALLYLVSPASANPPRSSLLEGIDQHQMSVVRNQFLKTHYTRILEFFIEHLTVEWFCSIPKGESGVELLESIFLSGPPSQVLLIITDPINSASVSYRVNKCVELLERLLTGQTEEMLWTQCHVPATQPAERQLWPTLVTLLASLPDRVTGVLGTQASSFFYPDQYIPHVCRAIHATLKKVHEALQKGKSCSVEFLGQLIGKLAVTGHKDALWDCLLPLVEDQLSRNILWCRVCERLICHVPDRSLESVIVPLLHKATWYNTVVKLLGHSVLTNQKMKFLLTNKLMMLRTFSEENILHNVIGYLSHSTTTRPLLVKLLTSLIDVWGDTSALKHTSYEQHFYISKAIMVCLAFTRDDDKAGLKKALIPKLMPGMQSHLESPIHKVRYIGMVVAESITTCLDPLGEKLEFEYETDDDTDKLKQLLVKPEEPRTPSSSHLINEKNGDEVLETPETESVNKMKSTAQKGDQNMSSNQEEELDSDDDLEPYDMSDDVKVTKFKQPVYLRDCMEGLISSDDPERVEACLLGAEILIYSHAVSVKEISVEFVKVLLHLQNNYAIPGFLAARHKAMVALTCVAPAKVADHLTTEFFARNYNTRQRMDILEVLTSAAKKLSDPSESLTPGQVGNKHTPEKTSLIQDLTTSNHGHPETESWKDIVQKRIASKTRRFAHGPQREPQVETTNKFGPVAGHFFFPLLAVHERKDGCVDLLGEDCLLLSRLVYSLGVIMYAALHTPIVRQMSKSLLELTWSLKYHPEPSVRQALLFTIMMTILATPPHMLFTDLQVDIVDTKLWLEEVFEKDSSTECKKMAAQTMLLLDKALREEFNQDEKT